LVVSLSAFRNDTLVHPSVDRPFRSLFYQLSPKYDIQISAVGGFIRRRGRRVNRELRLRAIQRATIGAAESATKSLVAGIEAHFKGPSGTSTGTIEWNAAIWGAGQIPGQPMLASQANFQMMLQPFSMQIPAQPDLITAAFVTPYFRDLLTIMSGQLTTALVNKKLPEILKIMRTLEPRLETLTPITEAGLQTIYADIGLEALAPISALGSGFVTAQVRVTG
jgi:hypothetical protein